MSNKERHWEKTKGLMILTLAIWFIFSIVIFMFGESLNNGSFLGYPLAYYMCAHGHTYNTQVGIPKSYHCLSFHQT